MTPAELTAWRQRLGMTKGEAAAALGLSPNGYGAYERGWVVQGNMLQVKRPIPRHVELACCELERRASDGWQTLITLP